MLSASTVSVLLALKAAVPPHIIHVVADDLGFDDLGHDSMMGNAGISLTPNINELIDTGVAMHEYYTFKVCSTIYLLVVPNHMRVRLGMLADTCQSAHRALSLGRWLLRYVSVHTELTAIRSKS
jgi:hypothetical protein